MPPKLRIFSLVGKFTSTVPPGVQTDSLTDVPSWLDCTAKLPEMLSPVSPTRPTSPDVLSA